MSKARRPDITEEVKDAIVRDYLRNDKVIILQLEYKISPGVLYRILHSRGVDFRRPDLVAEQTVTREQPVMTSPQLPAGNRFRIDIWNLTLETWDWEAKEMFGKMSEVLVRHIEQDPHDMLEAVGLLHESFTPEQLVDRTFEMVVLNVLSHDPDFVRNEDGSWRLLRSEATSMIWVRDPVWVKLDSPKRCRCVDGSPKRHCPNMAWYGFPRSNGIWAYCTDHMYGRRVRDGIVEIQVRADSPAGKRGYA